MRMKPLLTAISMLGGNLIAVWSQSYELDWDVVAGGGGTCFERPHGKIIREPSGVHGSSRKVSEKTNGRSQPLWSLTP